MKVRLADSELPTIVALVKVKIPNSKRILRGNLDKLRICKLHQAFSSHQTIAEPNHNTVVIDSKPCARSKHLNVANSSSARSVRTLKETTRRFHLAIPFR
jgi:hypothetical protein